MTTTPAHVTPDVLRWARESLGYSREQAAAKIGIPEEKLARAEAGEELLTLRQAERAADTYERPLAALFLSEPPAEEPQEAQFRPAWGARAALTARDAGARPSRPPAAGRRRGAL